MLDLVNDAACELKVSGAFSGYVLCFDFDSTLTNVQNRYQWRYGIE